MKVSVTQVGPMSFEATNGKGRLRMDGPVDLGGTEEGLRPMESLLASLAGCSAVDVVMILKQQREPLEGLEIQVEGKRAEAIPAVFTEIHLRFLLHGPVAESKARRAVALSAEKYCSISKMLEPTVRITHEVILDPVS